MRKFHQILMCIGFVLLLATSCESFKKKRGKVGRSKNNKSVVQVETTSPTPVDIVIIPITESAEAAASTPSDVQVATESSDKNSSRKPSTSYRGRYFPHLRQAADESDVFELGPLPSRSHRLDDPFESEFGDLDLDEDPYADQRPMALPGDHFQSPANDNYEDLLFDDYQTPEEEGPSGPVAAPGSIYLMSEV